MFDDPTFWVLVAFVIFVAVIGKMVAGKAAGALDARGEKIGNDLEEAEQLRIQAQELLATYERKQRDAAEEVEAIVGQAREEAARMTAQAALDLEQSLVRRERQAMERIAQAEAKAASQVRALVADTALDAARLLVAEHLSGAKANAMIAAATKELPTKLH